MVRRTFWFPKPTVGRSLVGRNTVTPQHTRLSSSFCSLVFLSLLAEDTGVAGPAR